MKKECLIIGLGIYGMSVATKLTEEGYEIMVIDKNMKQVERASKFVTKAICMDITSLDALEQIPLTDFDCAVVGIGEDVAVSIIACIALKDANIPYIIAKAGDKMHKKVLDRLGVDEIVLPEEQMGILTAEQIINKNKNI